MKRIFLFLFISFSWFILFAGKGEITFVETDVDLKSNGQAVVAYTVQWRVISGELHGFYFNGNDRLTIDRFSDESYAVDESGNKYKLDISKAGADQWDIVLAGGKGISDGKVTYVFWFATDFNEAGYVAKTIMRAEQVQMRAEGGLYCKY